MSTENIMLSSMSQWIAGKASCFIFSISFESRSTAVYKQVAKCFSQTVGFYNANHAYNDKALEDARGLSGNLKVEPINSDNPILTLDKMVDVIKRELGSDKAVTIALDITCFTKESLAMLIRVLRFVLAPGSKITCLYLKAEHYAYEDTKSGKEGWLSRGIANIRSILGYRGDVSLLAETHLIVLPGFETERAHSIVDTLQPNRLTVGTIDAAESVRPEFAIKTAQMTERLENYYPDQNIQHINFSAKDPFFTRDNILKCCVAAENTVVACLNNKVAAVGVCLAAAANPAIQLVYAQPLEFNRENRSVPSSEVLVFELFF